MTSSLGKRFQDRNEFISFTDTSAVVKLHDGLTFRGFDLQTGFVSPFGVLRALLRGRVLSLWYEGEEFLDYRQLAQHSLLFAVTGNFHISKDVYNCNFPKYPVSLETRLDSFRKTSFVLKTSMKLPGILSTDTSITTNIVCVAMDTRRPVPLPDWWVKKYERLCEKSTAPHFKYLVSPKELICRGVKSQPYTFPVPRRNHDSYGHVNISFYIQYCLDALEHHLYSYNIDCDIHTVSLLLKTAQFIHRGESTMGDILSVAFWDDETDPDSVCFDITKAGQSIYQARMQFYGGSEVSGTKSKL